jgi:hypothetical protein
MFCPMLRLTGLFLLIACAAATNAAAGAEESLAIRGYDPVAYFTLQRATPGSPRFEYAWDEHVYRFATAAHREAFIKDPVRYAPQFANFCAVALSRGERQPVNPEYWLISDGKLYLFGKSVGPGLFAKDPSILERANRNRALVRESRTASQ